MAGFLLTALAVLRIRAVQHEVEVGVDEVARIRSEPFDVRMAAARAAAGEADLGAAGRRPALEERSWFLAYFPRIFLYITWGSKACLKSGSALAISTF